MAANFWSSLLSVHPCCQIIDSIMALFRVDFSGRGELAERQQKLAQMLSRLQKISEGLNQINSVSARCSCAGLKYSIPKSFYPSMRYLLTIISVSCRVQRSCVCHQPNDSWSWSRDDVRDAYSLSSVLEYSSTLRFDENIVYVSPFKISSWSQEADWWTHPGTRLNHTDQPEEGTWRDENCQNIWQVISTSVAFHSVQNTFECISTVWIQGLLCRTFVSLAAGWLVYSNLCQIYHLSKEQRHCFRLGLLVE